MVLGLRRNRTTGRPATEPSAMAQTRRREGHPPRSARMARAQSRRDRRARGVPMALRRGRADGHAHPPWEIVHSRVWKTQIPTSACAHVRSPGNGRSGRPTTGYDHVASGGARCVARRSSRFHARRAGVLLAPSIRAGSSDWCSPPARSIPRADPISARQSVTIPGLGKIQRRIWRTHYREFLEFCFTESQRAALDEAT
jgi:hypothetical protein